MSQELHMNSGSTEGPQTRESASSDASVRIEIRDVGSEGSSNFTTSTLRVCKKQVLRPYWHLLTFIGWRSFNKESVYATSFGWRIFNFLYTSIILTLLLYSYSYELLACQWKLNAADVMNLKPAQTTIPVTIATTAATTTTGDILLRGDLPSDYWDEINPPTALKSFLPRRQRYDLLNRTKPDSEDPKKYNPACQHIVTTYCIPWILHSLAYVIGFYYFRVQENEQLDALMEKVFLQATTVQARAASQHNMIRKQRQFLLFGGMWVFVSGLFQCLYMWAFDFPTMPIFHGLRWPEKIFLNLMEVLGRTVFNSVILAIVVNFVTQCEMVKFYVIGLVMRLQEKSTCLKTAMKDILTLRQSLSQLNGLISKMTSLVGIILAELVVIGIFLIFVNEDDDPKVWAYRILFPFIWAAMLTVPLYQAARVNSICLRLQKVALEMRVFGYKGASLLDLDSFMQFVANAKLRAKLFHVTMVPSQLIFTCIVVAFVLLVLIQTSSVGPYNTII